MIREIGSEFWDVPTTEKENDLFPENTQWYLSGRSALQAIIKELGEARSVSLPSWCCDSMIKPFVDAGYEIHFYPVHFDGGLVQEISFDSDVLFLMDYFGYTSETPDLGKYDGIVIRDVTHSLFSAKYSDADYYFGSLRKWCGVWTGGYAWTRDKHKLNVEKNENLSYTVLRKKAMQMKEYYIKGLGNNKSGYLKAYEEAEACLDRNATLAPASDRDVYIAKRLDVEKIRRKRRVNATVLIGDLPDDWLIFHELKGNNCPMFVPLLVPCGKRNELRKLLIENEIYCPIHWPVTEYHDFSDKNMYFIYENELSLVCDQRYVKEDICRILKILRF